MNFTKVQAKVAITRDITRHRKETLKKVSSEEHGRDTDKNLEGVAEVIPEPGMPNKGKMKVRTIVTNEDLQRAPYEGT